MQSPNPIRCLILACGNTLRSDDSVGPALAAWAQERFRNEPQVRVISRQQWTPDLAAEIAAADSVFFVDASLKAPPGRVRLIPVSSRVDGSAPASHHLSPNQLLGLTRSLYDRRPPPSIPSSRIQIIEELTYLASCRFPQSDIGQLPNFLLGRECGLPASSKDRC